MLSCSGTLESTGLLDEYSPLYLVKTSHMGQHDGPDRRGFDSLAKDGHWQSGLSEHSVSASKSLIILEVVDPSYLKCQVQTTNREKH